MLVDFHEIYKQLNTMMGVPVYGHFNGATEEKSVELGVPHFETLLE